MDNPVIVVAIIGAISTFIGGVIVFFSNRKINNANTDIIKTDTYIRLSERIDALEKRDEEKEKRIDWLESELKRYINAYSLAVRFIHDRLPAIEIPNFLETDPRIKNK